MLHYITGALVCVGLQVPAVMYRYGFNHNITLRFPRISITTCLGVMLQVLCLQLPLAYGGVGLWSQLRGLPLAALSPEEISLAALGSDLIQLVGVIAIIKYGLLPQSSGPIQVRNVAMTFMCSVHKQIPIYSCLS